MRSLARVWSILVALACGCFSPTGTADTSSGTVAGTDPSTGVSTSSTTPITGAESTTGTTGGNTSRTGATTTGVVGTTGTSSETGATDTTGPGATETMMTGEAFCGDGMVDKGEQCDDGNQVLDDGCNNDCERDALFVFASSLALGPLDLSTPEKADDICTGLAQTGAGVPPVARGSKFVAWLSYDGAGGDAIDRVPYSPLEYRVTHPTLAQVFKDTDNIAANTSLDASLRYTEAGVEIPIDMGPCSTNAVWTGTNRFGRGTGHNCMSWTSDGLGVRATTGRTGAVDKTWTKDMQCSCAGALRIYCFEAG